MTTLTEAKPKAITLSNEEILRYSRHLIMPEVGMEGQQKLKAARVLCIGAGGLGSPFLMYLAAAGGGTPGGGGFDGGGFTNPPRRIIPSPAPLRPRKVGTAREAMRGLQSIRK